MSFIDSIRYRVALALVVTLPVGLLFWILVHPFVSFWRKLGPAWTHTVLWTVLVLGMVAFFRLRQPLLALEFGTNYLLLALGVGLLVLAARLRASLGREVGLKTLMGWPELDPGRHPVQLLTEGIYARIRHPRYVQICLALLGYALLTNYLAAYAVFLLSLPATYVITLLEEKELLDRFGNSYEQYTRTVPRFFPRFHRRRGEAPGETDFKKGSQAEEG